MIDFRHLAWIPLGASIAFFASFIFGDLLILPRDLYYLLYFMIILGFLGTYVRRSRIAVVDWASRRWMWGVVLGAIGGVVLVQGVLAQPATPPLSGGVLVWDLFWRGMIYGAVDGLILLAFPWVVIWRAFDAEAGSRRRKASAGLAAWLCVLALTTAYHAGYQDFRSAKIVQPNIGSTIGIVPTLASANPGASVLSHIALHIAAVLHSPETDLFLPPHRE